MTSLHNHFKLLNVAPHDTTQNTIEDIVQTEIYLNNETNTKFNTAEVKSSIYKLKNNKSPGTDGVINEFLRYAPDNVLRIILLLFNIILDTGIVPEEWCMDIICPIYKKEGSENDPNNYRGITLLSSLSKLFTSLLTEDSHTI